MSVFRLRRGPRFTDANAEYRFHTDPFAQRARHEADRDLRRGGDRYASGRSATSTPALRRGRTLAASGSLGLASATAVLGVLAASPARALTLDGGDGSSHRGTTEALPVTQDRIDLMNPPSPKDLDAHVVRGDFALFARTPAYCGHAGAEPPECESYDFRDQYGIPAVVAVVGMLAAWRLYKSRWVYPRWKLHGIQAALTDAVAAASGPNVRVHHRHLWAGAHLRGVEEVRIPDPEGFDRQVEADVARARRLATHLTSSRLWRRSEIRERCGGNALPWDIALRGGLLRYWQERSSGNDLLGNYFTDLAEEVRLGLPVGFPSHLVSRFRWLHYLLNDDLAGFEHPDFNELEALRWLEDYGIRPLLTLDPDRNTAGRAAKRAFWNEVLARVRTAEETRRIRDATTDAGRALVDQLGGDADQTSELSVLIGTLQARLEASDTLVERARRVLPGQSNAERVGLVVVSLMNQALANGNRADAREVLRLGLQRVADLDSDGSPSPMSLRLMVLAEVLRESSAGGDHDAAIGARIEEFYRVVGYSAFALISNWYIYACLRLQQTAQSEIIRPLARVELPPGRGNAAATSARPAAATPPGTDSVAAIEARALEVLIPLESLGTIARGHLLDRERRVAHIAAFDAAIAPLSAREDAALSLARLHVVREAILDHGSETNNLSGRVAALAHFDGYGEVGAFRSWLAGISRRPLTGPLADRVEQAYAQLPSAPTQPRPTVDYSRLSDPTHIARMAVARAVMYFIRGARLVEPEAPADSGGGLAETGVDTRRPVHRVAADRFGRGGPLASAAVQTLSFAAYRFDELRLAREAALMRLLAQYFAMRMGDTDHQLREQVAAVAKFSQGDPESVARWLDGLQAVNGVQLDGPHEEGTGAKIGSLNNSPLADLADAMREAALPRYAQTGTVLEVAAAQPDTALDAAALAGIFANLNEPRRIAQVAVETAAELLARTDTGERRLAAVVLRGATERLEALNQPVEAERLDLLAHAVAAAVGEHDAPVEVRLRAHLDAHPDQGPKAMIRWINELQVMGRQADRARLAAFIHTVDTTLLGHMPNFADLPDPSAAPEAQPFTLPDPPTLESESSPEPESERWILQPIAAAFATRLKIDFLTDRRLAAFRTAVRQINWETVADADGAALWAALNAGNIDRALDILETQFGIALPTKIRAKFARGVEP